MQLCSRYARARVSVLVSVSLGGHLKAQTGGISLA